MRKKLLCILIMILIAAGLSGCGNDKEAQKEARMQQFLGQKTEKNVRIERWKVTEINPTSVATRLVKIVKPDTSLEKTLDIEGHEDLQVGMDIIIEITVTDLSMDKHSDKLKNREFIQILYY